MVGKMSQRHVSVHQHTAVSVPLSAIIIVFNLNDVASLEHTKYVRMPRAQWEVQGGFRQGDQKKRVSLRAVSVAEWKGMCQHSIDRKLGSVLGVMGRGPEKKIRASNQT